MQLIVLGGLSKATNVCHDNLEPFLRQEMNLGPDITYARRQTLAILRENTMDIPLPRREEHLIGDSMGPPAGVPAYHIEGTYTCGEL